MRDLVGRLAETAAGFSGTVGYALADLTTRECVCANADELFPTASAVKLPILTAFHAFVEQGGASWDDVVDMSSEDIPGGSGVLQHLSMPRSISFRDAAWLMICLSDNLATNLLLRAMTIPRTNELTSALVGADIIVDSYAYYRPDIPVRSMGRATPRAFLRYLEALAGGRLPGAEATLDVARRQFYRNMIPRFMPFNAYGESAVRIANKTGSLPGIRTDIALLEAETKTIAMVFMTAGSADVGFSFGNEGEVCIGTLARSVYDAWVEER